MLFFSTTQTRRETTGKKIY